MLCTQERTKLKIKFYIALTTLVLLANGCSSTQNEVEYPNLGVSYDALKVPELSQMNRFPARYPAKAVVKNVEGCATIEYVITPTFDVSDVKVISSTQDYFAESAKNVIQKWEWSQLPKGVLNLPFKTQTRFEFCLDQPNSPCSSRALSNECPGEDVVYSIGSFVRMEG